MVPIFKNKKIIILAAAVGLLIFILLPIKIEYTIDSAGKVVPAREWSLIRGTDGNLITSLLNNKNGITDNYSVTQFQRGDAAKIEINNRISTGSLISPNDTIVKIFSNDINKEIAELRTELNSEEAMLNVLSSMEKKEIIETEKENVVYAGRQLIEQQRLYERKKKLFEGNLISREEYEIAEGAVALFKINLDIAKQRLAVVESGAKPEEINMVRAKINDLRNEISILQKKMSDHIILSPVPGVVCRSFSADTLLTVQDIEELIILIPVQVKEIKELKLNQGVRVTFAGSNDKYRGTIINWERSVRTVNQKQYVVAAAAVENSSMLFPGVSAECSIFISDMLLRDYLYKEFLSIFAN